MTWINELEVPPLSYPCGFCNNKVASARGWSSQSARPSTRLIYICPNCDRPTFFENGLPTPGPLVGRDFAGLPDSTADAYREARLALAVGAPTAAVLMLRKLLMNVAVSQGAEEGQSFAAYIGFLEDKGWVPPNGRSWADHIRKKGNEATHEIQVMSAEDAGELMIFAEMLLAFVYDFPNRLSAEG